MSKKRPEHDRNSDNGCLHGVLYRAAAVPVALVRRLDPAGPEGYRFTVEFPGGGRARDAGSGRHLGRDRRSRGQRRARPQDKPLPSRDRDRQAVRAAAGGHARDPAREDAARRDLRRAVGRQSERPPSCPTTAIWRRRGYRRPCSWTRSSRPSTRRPGRRSRRGCSRAGSRSPTAASSSTTRWPSCSRSRPTSSRCSPSCTARGRRRRPCCTTGGRCSRR